MKAMVHALQPKAVGLGEILDTWKIEQVLQCTYICRFPLFGALVVRVRVATAVIVYTFFIRVARRHRSTSVLFVRLLAFRLGNENS